MPLYRPSELHAFLQHVGARPNKRLSQNFLIDGNVLDKIIQHAGIQADSVVIEIGPGPGALTERLLSTQARVIAIEKDPVFAQALSRLDVDGRLTVVQADILECDLQTFVSERDFGRVQIVANLPYHITTPIIQKLVSLQNLICSCTVMLQHDVWHRFQKTADFSSTYVQYYARPSFCFVVARGAFYPRPAVDSAVIRLDLERRWPVSDEAQFFALLQQAFSHKRKMVRAALKAPGVDEALTRIALAPHVRVEELTVQQWVALWQALQILGL